MMILRPWLFAAVAVLLVTVAPPGVASAEEAGTFDVVVYGATPAGVCAAVGAAREGASVALVEPLQLIGGMMSSGLGFSDSNQCVRSTLGGLFEEFYLRVEAEYRRRGIKLLYEVAVKDHRPWTCEPHVAEGVFLALLKEAGVKNFTGQTLVKVEKDGPRIRSLTTDKSTFRARSWVDASYEGDLMAAAGVAFTVGRESKEEYGESLAGHQFPLVYYSRCTAG